MKKLIDANIILRYLLNDHPLLAKQAKELIEAGAYTLPEVLAEVVYVLKGVYQVERNEISNVLQDFLQEIDIYYKEAMLVACKLFSDTTLDFVDCILIAHHRVYGEEIATFDKKMNKLL